MHTTARFASALLLLVSGAAALGAQAKTPTEATGPIDANSPPCRWGATAKDEHGTCVWFGGTGGVSESGALQTWVFRDGAWSRPAFKESPACAETRALAAEARNLYAAVANRYYRSESAKAQSARLNEGYAALAERLGKSAYKDAAAARAEKAAGALKALASKLTAAPTAAEVGLAREAWTALIQLADVLAPEPSPRNYPGLAFDTTTKKFVLFGGEGEFGAYNDTWIFDLPSNTWTALHPAVAPSPRCGHGMIAANGKAYVAGGFAPNGTMSYCGSLWNRLPVDVWALDLKSGTWSLVKAGDGKPAPSGMNPPVELTLDAEGKTLAWKADKLSYGKKVGEATGSCAVTDAAAGDAETSAPGGTFRVRGEGFDPAWYENVPPADPAAVQATLKALPANKWINMKPPVRHVNRDWGTTVLDLEHDQLLHWAGGHSSHCGTDVAHYSLATNRWHILYTPEMPFEYCYSNDGAPAPPLSGKPWGPHSYLSYAWDEVSGKMIWAGKHGAYQKTNPFGLWTYDPDTYDWSRPAWKFEKDSFDVERHKTCMVRTPHGIVVWADKRGGSGGETGLWLARVNEHVFTPLAATDRKDMTTLPFTAFGDRHGITYDSKRDRVLIFHFGIKEKHKIWACDLKTKAVTVLAPKNSAGFPESAGMGREATYLPDDDVVLISTPIGKEPGTLIYDCAADEWLKMPSTSSSADPAKPVPGFGVSTGVDWDPKRKLLWLVQTDGSVYAMRFDRASAGLKPTE
ncbi:MAG: hypothetical protein KIS92_23865 [Planctomycetota bacterium]|nr:hypothetical protein [Planctomycetota bacterium]